MTQDKPSNVNIPNVLTVVRIVLVPVFIALLFIDPHHLGMRLAATGVFVLAMLTDLADGYIARRYDLITDFGKLWDPVADKALTGAAFVSLSILGELPWYFTVLILLREWGITWVRGAIAKYGVMAANRGGKSKTLVQTFALVLFCLGLAHLPSQVQLLAWLLMWAALILTVVTGVDYLRQAWTIRRTARRDAGHDLADEAAETG